MGFFSVMLFNNAPKNNNGDADKTISLHQSQMHLELTGTFFFSSAVPGPFSPHQPSEEKPTMQPALSGPI